MTFTTGATNTTALIFVYAGAYNGVPIQADDFLLVEPLAAPWQQADIGAVGLTGAGGQRDGGFDIRGAGDNIWGTADSFRMIYRPITNDCRITARVLKVDPTDPAAKVGITLREGTTAGARHITLDWMPQQIVGALWRSTTNGTTASQWAAGNVTTAPWLRLERAGNTFTGSWSPDGVHWTPVVTNVLSLPATLQAGLVVCAHNAAQLNEGLLDQVSVGPLTARIPEELAWNSAGAGGTWDVVSTNWRNATASSVVWSNALADGAAFGSNGVGMVSLASDITVRTLTFNTAGYNLADRVLTLAQPFVTANADATIASTLAGTAGLVKSGAGTLTLSGTNTYGGGTTVNAGRLRVGNPAALGGTNGTLTAAGGVLDLGGLGLTVGPVTIAGGAISNGTLTATAYAGQSGTVNAVLAGSNVALIKTTGGVLALSATNTYSGGTLLNEGTLSISSLANLGGLTNPLTFSGGLLQISGNTLTNLNLQAVNWSTFDGGFDIANGSTTFTVTNAISGGGALTKAGPGTLRLTTPASYSGATTINNGTLLLTNGGGIYRGVGGGPVTLNYGSVLSVSGDIGYTSAALGNMAAQAYGFFINGGTFRHAGNSNAKTGQPGAGRLFYIGEHGATLDSATAGQEFRLGYRYDYGSAVQSPFGGTLTLTGVGNGDFNYTLSGSGGLVKSGAGTWKLTGTNYFFSGPTVVNSGTLLVQGNLTNSPVTVWGGTLGGNGAISQSVTVQAGGSLAPGNGGLGTLTLQSNLTLLAGSQVAVEVNASTGASDLVANLNFISYGGTLVVTNLAGTVTNQQSFQLFSASAATNSFSAIVPASPAAGLIWVFNPANGMLNAQSMATNPTNLTASVSGTNLTFSWPADHIGWRLLVQTNRLNLGLSSNTNDWAVVPGSTATNQMVIPMNPAKPAAFYRMAY